MAFDLYQPGAPRFFRVDTDRGAGVFVSYRGQAWIEYVDVKLQPASPASTLSSSPMVDKPLAASKRPDSGLARIDAVPAAAQFTAPVVQQATPSSRADIVRKVTAGPGLPPRPIAGEAAAANTAARRFFGRSVAGLHARLDEAREAYSRARSRAEAQTGGDDLIERRDAYCALIAELDRVDPRHFGRPPAHGPVKIGRLAFGEDRLDEMPPPPPACQLTSQRSIAMKAAWARRRAAAAEGEAQ